MDIFGISWQRIAETDWCSNCFGHTSILAPTHVPAQPSVSLLTWQRFSYDSGTDPSCSTSQSSLIPKKGLRNDVTRNLILEQPPATNSSRIISVCTRLFLCAYESVCYVCVSVPVCSWESKYKRVRVGLRGRLRVCMCVCGKGEGNIFDIYLICARIIEKQFPVV